MKVNEVKYQDYSFTGIDDTYTIDFDNLSFYYLFINTFTFLGKKIKSTIKFLPWYLNIFCKLLIIHSLC